MTMSEPTTPPLEGSALNGSELIAALLVELRRLNKILARQQEAESGPALLSKREAARRLGLSRGRSIDALLASGRLRAVRVGRRLRIPLVEVDRFAREGEGGVPSVPVGARRRGASRAAAAAQVAQALRERGF